MLLLRIYICLQGGRTTYSANGSAVTVFEGKGEDVHKTLHTILAPGATVDVARRYYGLFVSASEGCSFIDIGANGQVVVRYSVRKVTEQLEEGELVTSCPMISITFPRAKS